MSAETVPRAAALFEASKRLAHARTDRLFAILIPLQFIACLFAAVFIAPRIWSGGEATRSIHLWVSIGLGASLSALPLALIWLRPGERLTRYVIACAQMLFSALLIHLTGGRIETHFHVFGSLAVLAFYRDWTVLIPATAVVAIDNLARGVFWPESVFGVLVASPWRAVEHTGWVLFENAFLVYSCVVGTREMRAAAEMTANLEGARAETAETVRVRTSQLEDALHALRFSEERYEIAIKGSGDALWDWDLDSNSIYYAPGWAELLGCDPATLTDSPSEWFGRIASRGLSRFHRQLTNHLEGETSRFELEVEMRRENGETRWMLCRATATRDADGVATRLAGSLADITELKLAQEALARLAQHDRLTDLPNRHLFCERLAVAMSEAAKGDGGYAVLFFDFDRFKLVNDGLGHNIGDALLVSIADRFRLILRDNDTAARFGGDEFVVLLNGVSSLSDAEGACRRYLETFAEPHTIEGHMIVSTASIGLVMGDDRYATPDEIIRDADAAMYKAKSAGRGGYRLFDRRMHAEAVEKLRVEHELRGAIGSSEIRVFYQPVIALSSGKLGGFEALVRWEHPERGLVTPDEFIPVAEDTGLIVPLGDYVMRRACRQIAEWRERYGDHPDIGMNVNVSRRQIASPNFLETVREAVRDAGIPPDALKLEITESTIMERGPEAKAVMQNLREFGVKLAMDDFGTGHSSLSCLHSFPIDILKIDRSFVINMESRRAFTAIVHAIIALADHLGMEVVAEGVETDAQLSQLQAMGCNFGQGFLFSRPMSVDVAEAYLRAGPTHRVAA